MLTFAVYLFFDANKYNNHFGSIPFYFARFQSNILKTVPQWAITKGRQSAKTEIFIKLKISISEAT